MRWLAPIMILSLAGCGGGQERTNTPDESDDLAVTSASREEAQLPPDLDGSRWRWVQAHCTEGPLDLVSRGYAASLRVAMDPGGLTLVTDQQLANEGCQHTLVTRAVPPQVSGTVDWQMEEVERVAVPHTEACFGRPEAPRPGTVRGRDGRLEVLTQRSQWCNGLEVRMVFEREAPALLDDDQIVRRYVAYFSLGDAEKVASLFAETASLLEPFTRTETGDPYRHDGRPAVQQWFSETFATAPWRAMRITEITAGEAQGGSSSRVVTWEYMDPRLAQPLAGRTRFTIAAGEIFEAQIELTGEPALRDPAAGEGAPSEDS